MTAYSLGRVPHPETHIAASLYPVTDHPDYSTAPRQREWWWEGGAWLDQGQTGTCVANALSHRLADSPVPESGITEITAQRLYVQATGDTSMQEGTSALTVCRYMKSKGQISAYHWVTSPDELRNTVMNLGSVCIGITWYESCFTPAVEWSQQYLDIQKSSGVAGGHEVLINGIRLDTQTGEPPFYRVKNSWGRGWGNGGTVRAGCAQLEELIFNENGDAVLITEP